MKSQPKVGRPPVEEPLNVKFSIRLTETTNEQVQAYCRERGITRNEFIRQALEAALQN